jgi:serine protease
MNTFSLFPEHKIRTTFKIGDFHGFSAQTSEEYVRTISRHPLLKVVEQDHTVHIQYQAESDCTVQNGATWGIDRISERAIALDGMYQYEFDGTGVDAYVIDTGVYIAHEEFGSRAEWGATFTPDKRDEDCNGHGTHCAGTVGGTVYGVAKNVHIIAVKVLNCGGSGTWEGVIAGVNWAAEEFQKRKKPGVVNMSLGGGKSVTLNAAVEAAIAKGLTFAIAAGNNNGDACFTSPASVKAAITVGSTDVADNNGIQTDIRSSFSNWGTCTDIFAPGSMVTSAWIGGPKAVRTISGTSMASPHVCGGAALYLQSNPTATPDDVDKYLGGDSTKGVISLNCFNPNNDCAKSPNRLLYSCCDV